MTDDFLTICQQRGFFHQCTDEDALRQLVTTQIGVPAYIGFDCTAPSLHVGSLLQIMLLRWWQKCGQKPIVLMGGGTTKIGDPSGKDEARKMLTDDDIAANMDGIKQVFAKFLTFDHSPLEGESKSAKRDSVGGQTASSTLPPTKSQSDLAPPQGGSNNKAIMVNNDDWLKDLPLIELLQYVAPHFSINRMLTMDSVKNRLDREHEMSFLEFNYMVMQAFDFHVLNATLSCRLQMGGSDQWGNIVMGVDLNRRLNVAKTKFVYHANSGLKRALIVESESYHKAFGMTSPLITTASGAKMGKTAAGAIWLNHDEANPNYSLSPFDYWQFWRNTEDGDVERFLKLFTDLELPDIASIMSGNINDAKKRLATEATAMLHGEPAAHEAAETARQLFEQGGMGAAMPEFTIERSALEAGIPAFKLLHMAGLAESGGEARRLIKGNGAKINDAPFTAEDQAVTLADLTADGFIKLSKGKKQHIKVLVA